MSEKKEKIYLPSSIKEIKTQYGAMIIANLKVDELQKNSKNGWVSMVISERREPSEKGATHYAYVNDYKPKDTETAKSKKDDNDDLPF
jgi:hypothetical protein|tara:strand:- start:73 stop:336 length:264 start_codon:yes stop_codon:yes gene_type:complete